MPACDSKEKRDMSMASTEAGNVSKSTAQIGTCGLAIELFGNRQMEQSTGHQDLDDVR